MKTTEFNRLVDKQLDLFKKYPQKPDELEKFPQMQNLQLRLQRALSWLNHAMDERLANEFDARFIFLWVSFNALYGKITKLPSDDNDDPKELSKIGKYFKTLVRLDKEKRIHGVIQRNDGKIQHLLENQYIYYRFWNNKLEPYNGRWKNWKARLEDDQRKFKNLSKNGGNRSILKVLRIVFNRLNTVRNQLIHGSASKDDELAWGQVNLSAELMSNFLPVFIDLMMENHDIDWGTPHYPRVCGKPVNYFQCSTREEA